MITISSGVARHHFCPPPRPSAPIGSRRHSSLTLKRRLTTAWLGLATLLVVTGCDEAPPASPPASSAPVDLRRTEVEHPPVVTDPDGLLTLRVPVTNRTPEPITFGKPVCGCTCIETELAPVDVTPGGTTVLTSAVRPGLRTGRQVFGCSWRDQLGNVWSGRAALELLPRRKWEPTVAKLEPDGSGGFRGAATMVEHGLADALSPVGAFDAADGQVSLAVGEPTI